MSELDLSIVIPTWNQIQFTRACVESLRLHTDVSYELIIVDNGSDPSNAAEAERLADKFVGNDTNLGFARAMNQGLAIATGTAVAFVNNDTVFPPLWASRLLETMGAEGSPGIVMPAVTAAGNQAAVRESPAERRTVFAPFSAIPSGVIYAMRRDTILELGGWTERYGIASAEDLDLLFTVWVNGLSVVLDERVLVEHESAASALKLPNRDALYAENRLAFADRWATAEPDEIAQLSSCPDSVFVANIERARIAGTWMEKWFRAMDVAAAESRARKAAARKSGSTTPPARGPGFTSRLANKMKRVRARVMKR